MLHGLDFDIPPGRIYGLIGHNGAGKTTTLNAILGLSSYEGTVRVLGEDPFAKRAKLMENVAFISDVASLPRFLRVRELFALLTNIHPNFSQEKARSFLEGTDVKMEQKIKNLSKGMIAQLHLAVVMAIDAKLLVLDEPTLGLDITYPQALLPPAAGRLHDRGADAADHHPPGGRDRVHALRHHVHP